MFQIKTYFRDELSPVEPRDRTYVSELYLLDNPKPIYSIETMDNGRFHETAEGYNYTITPEDVLALGIDVDELSPIDRVYKILTRKLVNMIQNTQPTPT